MHEQKNDTETIGWQVIIPVAPSLSRRPEKTESLRAIAHGEEHDALARAKIDDAAQGSVRAMAHLGSNWEEQEDNGYRKPGRQ